MVSKTVPRSYAVISSPEVAGLDFPSKMLEIREQRVLISHQFAALYEVEPRVLMQQAQRNKKRFPSDFMFQLSADEFANLKSQIVISSWGSIRKLPFAFTEQCVAMLSSVLKSERAVAVNIEIMRTFVKLRGMLSEHTDLKRKLNALEKKYDDNLRMVFKAIHQLMNELVHGAYGRRRIGFIQEKNNA